MCVCAFLCEQEMVECSLMYVKVEHQCQSVHLCAFVLFVCGSITDQQGSDTSYCNFTARLGPQMFLNNVKTVFSLSKPVTVSVYLGVIWIMFALQSFYF